MSETGSPNQCQCSHHTTDAALVQHLVLAAVHTVTAHAETSTAAHGTGCKHTHLQDVAELQEHLEAVDWVAALCCCCEAYQLWLTILIVVLFTNL